MPSFSSTPHCGAFAAIPTKWNGVQFRSRLEARWAAFFTLLGWEWAYEPFDLEGYIPDFLLHFPDPVLVEVKPTLIRDGRDEHNQIYAEVAERIKATSWGRRPALIVGSMPTHCASRKEFYVGAFTSDINPGCDHGDAVDYDAVILSDHGRDKCRHRWPHWCLGSMGLARGRCLTTGDRHEGNDSCSNLVTLWLEAGNQVQWRSPRR